MPLGLYIFKMISLWLVTSVGVGRRMRDQPFSTRDATVKIQMTSTKLDVGPFSVSAHTVHSARVHTHTHTHTHTPDIHKHTQSDRQTHTQTETERESEGPIDTQTETETKTDSETESERDRPAD